MKQGVRVSMVFLAGLLVGGMVAAGFVAWRWNRDFQRFRISGIAEQALNAREIYAGRGRQSADRIRAALPSLVLGVERSRLGVDGREWTYWLVSDVYKESGMAVPAQLKPILAALPPRPSCRRPVSKGVYPVAP